MAEEWRPMPSDGRYEVSSMGRIRKTDTHRVLVGTPGANGYLRFSGPKKDGKQRPIDIHVAVAATFIGPRPNGMVINHKNGIKADNRAENLEYTSQRENLSHALRTGLRVPQTRVSDVDAIRMQAAYVAGARIADVARQHGLSWSTVCNIVKGRRLATKRAA